MIRAPRRPRCACGVDALRGLGVLLVLLGVVAMHALGGGSHMVMTSPTQAADRPAAAGAAMPGMPAPPDGNGAARTPSPADQLAAVVAAAAPAGGHQAMPVCLAVLAVLLALFLPGVVRVARTAPVAAQLVPQFTPLGRGPPRALLAQLCVLRT